MLQSTQVYASSLLSKIYVCIFFTRFVVIVFMHRSVARNILKTCAVQYAYGFLAFEITSTNHSYKEVTDTSLTTCVHTYAKSFSPLDNIFCH
uniref:Uncharacterized protein n=1 Tax=Rhizophora mucronata TaxID=61149 RepID=A0A2P2LEQ5_RHIMU